MGALVYELGAYEPTSAPLAIPLVRSDSLNRFMNDCVSKHLTIANLQLNNLEQAAADHYSGVPESI